MERKIKNKTAISRISVVVVSALIFAVLNIIHVIIGLAKTPPGQTYLATGHYYLDYFEYLQAISQGLRGLWLPINPFTIENTGVEIRFWPYILIGKIAGLLHLSSITAFWASVVILTFLLVMLTYLALKKILYKEIYSLRIGAFFITVLACYFYRISVSAEGFKIISFDIWYSPSNFFARYSPVPYHLFALILVLVSILIAADFFEKIKTSSFAEVFFRAVLLTLAIISLLTFQPYTLVPLLSAFLIFGIYYFFLALGSLKTLFIVKKITVFFGVLVAVILPAALMIKNFYTNAAFLSDFKSIETSFSQRPTPVFFVLNIGPIFILAIMGLKDYFRKIRPAGLLIFFFALSSYILYFSPFDRILGTHNGRFLSPLNYIFFGASAVLALKKIGRGLFFRIIILMFIVFSLPSFYSEIKGKLENKNLFSPITYLPSDIVEGFKFLEKDSGQGAVLTTPSQFLGTVVPTYTGKKVFIARHPATINYAQKAYLADRFYRGDMAPMEAEKFLAENGIRFVVLTSIEGYPLTNLSKYTFLKEIYRRRDIVIFKYGG